MGTPGLKVELEKETYSMKNIFIQWLLRQQDDQSVDNRYVSIFEREMKEAVKEKIEELEKLAEEYGAELQEKYKALFEKQGKSTLRIWVCRDIDGFEENGLAGSQCLEKEHRSQLAIDFEGLKHDEDFYAGTMYLWHRNGAGRDAGGAVFNSAEYDLKEEIEKKLNELLIQDWR